MASGRTKALVTPALLTWARLSAGYDVATVSRKLKIRDAVLLDWESGAQSLSMAQMRKLAELYKRPIAVFYLPEPPVDFDALRDFRRLAGSFGATRSSRLAIETRVAQQRREAAVEIARQLGDEMVSVPLSAGLDDTPTSVAARIRDKLGVSLDTQFGWANHYEALHQWKAAVERIGALVFQTEKLPVTEARGFSLSFDVVPVIVLNSQESVRGRIFTLMHELAHLLLRSGGVCDLHDDEPSPSENDRVEVFCNRVAGAILVPPESLAQSLRDEGLATERAWEYDALRALADRYGVSAEVMLRSLVLAGRYPANEYALRRDRFQVEYERERKPAGPVPYFRKALNWSGRRFATMALAAYDDEYISAADVTSYLRIKVGQLEKLRAALRVKVTVD